MARAPAQIPNVQTGLDAGLELASRDGYLGDWDTVEGLLRVSIKRLMDSLDEETLRREAEVFSLVFQGQEPAYHPIPDFHTRAGMSGLMARHADIRPDQSFGDMLRQLYVWTVLPLIELAAKGDAVTDEQAMTAIDGQVEYATSILIGTADVTHPVAAS